MNPAKLGRSRDVSEHTRGKIGKNFRFSNLAMLYTAFLAVFEREELVQKDLDLSRRSPVFHPATSRLGTYTFSGRQSLLRLQTGPIL